MVLYAHITALLETRKASAQAAHEEQVKASKRAEARRKATLRHRDNQTRRNEFTMERLKLLCCRSSVIHAWSRIEELYIYIHVEIHTEFIFHM